MKGHMKSTALTIMYLKSEEWEFLTTMDLELELEQETPTSTISPDGMGPGDRDP